MSFGLERIGFRLTNSLACLLWNLPDMCVPTPSHLFAVVYGWKVYHGGEETREHSRSLGTLVILVPLLQDLRGRSTECREALQQPRVRPGANACSPHFRMCWEAILKWHDTILESVWRKLD